MPPPKETPFFRSLGTISWIVSLVLCFALLPFLHVMTLPWITGIARIYTIDPGVISTIGMVWLVLLGFLVFAVLRALFAGLLSALGLWLVLWLSGRQE